MTTEQEEPRKKTPYVVRASPQPEQFHKLSVSDTEQHAKVVKAAGIKAD